MNADESGQVWLSGVRSPEDVRVVDVCLQQLCRDFCEGPKSADKLLSSELDDLSLASLLLAVGWGDHAPKVTSDGLAACLDQVSDRFWGDLLPWQLALEFCRHNPLGVCGLKLLTANLDHHNSSARRWTLELAWIVRNKLNQADVVPKLLKNVADTLGYWNHSLGLCRTLLTDDAAFWQLAARFQANEYAEQYSGRLALAREQGLVVFQQPFQEMELRLRRKICELALGLTSEEIQIAKGVLN
jgi:hypothetical protein